MSSHQGYGIVNGLKKYLLHWLRVLKHFTSTENRLHDQLLKHYFLIQKQESQNSINV